MCHECHRVSHDIGFISFFELYGRKIFENFIYPLIRRCFNEIRQREGAVGTVLDGDSADSDDTVASNFLRRGEGYTERGTVNLVGNRVKEE